VGQKGKLVLACSRQVAKKQEGNKEYEGNRDGAVGHSGQDINPSGSLHDRDNGAACDLGSGRRRAKDKRQVYKAHRRLVGRYRAAKEGFGCEKKENEKSLAHSL